MSLQFDMYPETLHLLDESAPLKEKAYKLIQQMIISGELQPGDRLHEVNLSEKFQMSRGPIREAIQMLVSDNWLIMKPRHGTFVKNPSYEEVENLFDVKKLLEVESARLAAKNVTSEAIEYLEKLVDDSFQVINDDEKIYPLNVEFHLSLSRLSGNDVLSDLVERAEKQLGFYFVLVSGLRNEEAWQEHSEMLQALKNKDSDKMAELMLDHTEHIQQAFRDNRQNKGRS